MNQGRHVVSPLGVTVEWKVDLEHRVDIPLEQIMALQIYVGGMAVANTSRQFMNDTQGNLAYNRDSKMGEFRIPNHESSIIGLLYVRIGPFGSFEDYLLQDGKFLPDLERLGRHNPQMKVSVDSILFHPSSIRGMLDNLGVARLTASQVAAAQRRAAQDCLSQISGGQQDDRRVESLRRQVNALLALVD